MFFIYKICYQDTILSLYKFYTFKEPVGKKRCHSNIPRLFCFNGKFALVARLVDAVAMRTRGFDPICIDFGRRTVRGGLNFLREGDYVVSTENLLKC